MRLLLAASLIMLPGVAIAAKAPSTDKSEELKKICKADPQDTDSRVRRRICKTEAEWNGESGKKPNTERTQKQSQ